MTLLSSDRVRKEIAHMSPAESAVVDLGEGLYTLEWTRQGYAELMRRASMLLPSASPWSWTLPGPAMSVATSPVRWLTPARQTCSSCGVTSLRRSLTSGLVPVRR